MLAVDDDVQLFVRAVFFREVDAVLALQEGAALVRDQRDGVPKAVRDERGRRRPAPLAQIAKAPEGGGVVVFVVAVIFGLRLGAAIGGRAHVEHDVPARREHERGQRMPAQGAAGHRDGQVVDDALHGRGGIVGRRIDPDDALDLADVDPAVRAEADAVRAIEAAQDDLGRPRFAVLGEPPQATGARTARAGVDHPHHVVALRILDDAAGAEAAARRLNGRMLAVQHQPDAATGQRLQRQIGIAVAVAADVGQVVAASLQPRGRRWLGLLGGCLLGLFSLRRRRVVGRYRRLRALGALDRFVPLARGLARPVVAAANREDERPRCPAPGVGRSSHRAPSIASSAAASERCVR